MENNDRDKSVGNKPMKTVDIIFVRFRPKFRKEV